MHIEQYDLGAEHVVTLSGRITIDSSPNLRLLLLECLRAPAYKTLTVNLSEALYIDTSALAIFLEVLKAARGLGKTLRLTGARGRPRYLLEATGFIHFFSEVAQPTSR